MLTLEVLSLSIHSFKSVLPYASEIWTKSYGPNYTKFWAFWQKLGSFYNHFWQRVDAILEDVFVAQIIFNAEL